jgi:hypothetical protein
VSTVVDVVTLTLFVALFAMFVSPRSNGVALVNGLADSFQRNIAATI